MIKRETKDYEMCERQRKKTESWRKRIRDLKSESEKEGEKIDPNWRDRKLQINGKVQVSRKKKGLESK